MWKISPDLFENFLVSEFNEFNLRLNPPTPENGFN